MTGPYQNLPAHGIAFDTWAGIINPAVDEEGFTYIPEHASIGIHAGPLMGALGILAGVIRARESGEGCFSNSDRATPQPIWIGIAVNPGSRTSVPRTW